MTERAKGKLIAFRSDRLGARLVSLMNAMRLAEDLGTEFECAWIETTGVGDVFNDPTELFDNAFVDQHFLAPEAWREERPNAEVLSAVLQRQPSLVKQTLDAGQNIIVGNAFGVIHLKGEDQEDVTKRFRRQFKNIPFAAAIRDAMQRLDQSLAGHTAYHIRRGDLTDDPKAKHKAWPHKVVPNEFYECHIERALSEDTGGAVLFSDDQASIDHYRSKYPALKTIDSLVSMDGLTEAQRDFFELYAMSCCATIIAPARSAFSSTAAELSGSRKVSVGDDLGPKLQAKANDALYQRLCTCPDSFESDGHIGQALAHTGDWLESQQRWSEAGELFASHVAAGVNISFLYPRAMRYQHLAGAVSGVVATAGHMADRPVIYIKDQATAEVLHGYALLRSGQIGPAFEHIINGFWHAPSVAAARMIMPLLVESRFLDDTNFLPVSQVQLDLQRRRGPLKLLFQEFSDLATLKDIKIPAALGSMDAVLWDWAPLMRSVSFPALIRQGAIERAEQALSAYEPPTGQEAEHASLKAVMRAFAGAPEKAIETLTILTERDDASPMTWQRLSHAHWMARRYGKAATAARRAFEAAPETPAMAAWRGVTTLRVRKAEEALKHLTFARENVPGLASFPYLQAQALHRLKRISEATACAEAALKLAPLEVNYAMLLAKLLDDAGDCEAGISVLLRLVEAQRAPGKLFVKLLEMLERMGDVQRYSEINAIAQSRIPNHPAIASIEAETA